MMRKSKVWTVLAIITMIAFFVASPSARAQIGTQVINNGAVTSAKMSATGVSAGSYGDTTHIPIFTVDAAGRITGVTLALIGSGSGTVTSVALSAPSSLFTVSGSPITGLGTLTLAFASQTSNQVFRSGDSVGVPGFSALDAADIPALAESKITNLTSDLAGKQATGNYLTGLTGDVTASGPGSAVATLASSGVTAGTYTNATVTVNAKGLITAASSGAGGSSGTVTSVAISLPGIFTLAGSPITTSGTITATLATELANLVWAGPTTGSAAAPTFRSLVAADLPTTGTAGTVAYPASLTVDAYGRIGAYTAGTAPFSPAAVQAPSSVGFASATWNGPNETPLWHAANTTSPNSGSIDHYGWETSPDNSTWTTEVFDGSIFPGASLTTGNSQYARARSYPLTPSGTTPTPSGWVTSSAQAFTAPRLRSMAAFLTATPTAGADTEEFVFPYDQSGNSVTYTLNQFIVRANVVSTSSSTIKVETSTGTGAFTVASTSQTFTLAASGNESITKGTGVTTTVTAVSGSKARFNFVTVGASLNNVHVEMIWGY